MDNQESILQLCKLLCIIIFITLGLDLWDEDNVPDLTPMAFQICTKPTH